MAGMSTGRSDRMPRRATRVAIAAGLLALAIALPATAFAGKGGGTPAPAWIALATVSGQSIAGAEPQLGSAVKFATGYSTNTRNPWVSVMCYQAGALVYGEGGKPTAEFVLGGATSDWAASGGTASCRAELGDLYWKGGRQYYTYLAHTTFEAGG